jgi:hypothetical protein
MSDTDKFQTRFWGRQVDDVMTEIARQAATCNVRLLDPGVVEAVVHNNESICGNRNPRAFKKLRESLMVGLMMRDKAVEKLGPLGTDAMVAAIRERLQQHAEGRQGGSA